MKTVPNNSVGGFVFLRFAQQTPDDSSKFQKIFIIGGLAEVLIGPKPGHFVAVPLQI